MKGFGYFTILIGVLMAIHALTMETSLKVDYPDGNTYGLPERINNLGLMQDKQNYLMFSGVLLIIGVILGFVVEEKVKPFPSGSTEFANVNNDLEMKEWLKVNPYKTPKDFYKQKVY